MNLKCPRCSSDSTQVSVKEDRIFDNGVWIERSSPFFISIDEASQGEMKLAVLVCKDCGLLFATKE